MLRRAYDRAGMRAVDALTSMVERAGVVAAAFPGADAEQMDFLSETGQLATPALLGAASAIVTAAPVEAGGGGGGGSGGDDDDDDKLQVPASVDGSRVETDACPRSVEEAVQYIESHPDRTVRYYALWWVYKFKVAAAVPALVAVLRNDTTQTALGGFGLRRRAALALGAVTHGLDPVVLSALADALDSSDYYLRYRAAEAIASIALRELRHRNTLSSQSFLSVFPESVLDSVISLLRRGAVSLDAERSARSPHATQEHSFDLGHLDPAVAEKLRAVFAQRQENETRARRTTMTPQLGVDPIDHKNDHPFEWLLKALAAATQLHLPPSFAEHTPTLCATVRVFLHHPHPLVVYAAHKALYSLTAAREHADALVAALAYGVEHHYSQRVLIRDLGDIGYAPAAPAIAACPMVENSFKILALNSILAFRNHDPTHPDVQSVLAHMDSLL
jgi:HEAT repeats